jgi:hypothetical protein
MGLDRNRVRQLLDHSPLLLNVNGFISDSDLLGRVSRRVYLDIDPGFGHIWQETGLYCMFHDHDRYVTVGRNIGKPDCDIPTCGIDWLTIPPPVVLDYWPVNRTGLERNFTTVASWRSSLHPVTFNGRMYGLRSRELRKFAQLPRLTGETLEIALRIDPLEVEDRELLAQNGWILSDPNVVAADPWSYREYIQHSKAELMVAKNIYVEMHSGWFSDRSVCYLASGKPVLAQDTGLAGLYPLGEGLLSFATLDQARAGIESITSDYERHAHAARTLAEQCFDSDKVLGELLTAVGL